MALLDEMKDRGEQPSFDELDALMHAYHWAGKIDAATLSLWKEGNLKAEGLDMTADGETKEKLATSREGRTGDRSSPEDNDELQSEYDRA